MKEQIFFVFFTFIADQLTLGNQLAKEVFLGLFGFAIRRLTVFLLDVSVRVLVEENFPLFIVSRRSKDFGDIFASFGAVTVAVQKNLEGGRLVELIGVLAAEITIKVIDFHFLYNRDF